MNFERLLQLVGDEPVFESTLLLAGNVKPAAVRLQLTRWLKAGRIYRLRRGLYALAPPYQKVRPHAYVIANRLLRASYVSCQSALVNYGLIPEFVLATVSVSTLRPAFWETPLGVFQFRHIQQDLFRGYVLTDLGHRQQAFIATPEKALLDLIYLHPGSDAPGYLRELRLQNLERLNLDELDRQAAFYNSPKLRRAVEGIARLVQIEIEEYVSM